MCEDAADLCEVGAAEDEVLVVELFVPVYEDGCWETEYGGGDDGFAEVGVGGGGGD